MSSTTGENEACQGFLADDSPQFCYPSDLYITSFSGYPLKALHTTGDFYTLDVIRSKWKKPQHST
jgi:hypothetical protein